MTHTQKDITKALTFLAFRAGNVRATIKDLKAEGIAVSDDTLVKWRDQDYSDDYNKIRDKHKAEFEAEAVRDMRDRLRQAADAERLAIEKTVAALEHTSQGPKDLATTALNLSRVKKENVDKLLALTGRPTQIIDDRSAEGAIRALVAKKILKPVSNGHE